MISERRNVGVTVAFLLVLAIAGLALIHLATGLPGTRPSSTTAGPTPVSAPRSDGTFEPISLDYEDDAGAAARGDAVPGDYARIRDLEERRDVDGLAAIALTPIAGDGLNEEQLQHERRLRVSALHALANVGSESAMRTLRSVLEDSDRELVLRLAAASALARAGDDTEIAYLRGRLEAEPSNIVRERIRLALEQRGG